MPSGKPNDQRDRSLEEGPNDVSAVDHGPDPLSARGQKIRELMAGLAADLDDQATLCTTRAVDEDDDELLELVPRNVLAAPVSVLHVPSSDTDEIVLRVAGFDEPDVDLDWIALVVQAAVDGRVLTREGAGRRRLEIEMSDGTRRSTEHLGVRGLLPAPGWTRRARTTRYRPYSPRKAGKVNPEQSR